MWWLAEPTTANTQKVAHISCYISHFCASSRCVGKGAGFTVGRLTKLQVTERSKASERPCIAIEPDATMLVQEQEAEDVTHSGRVYSVPVVCSMRVPV